MKLVISPAKSLDFETQIPKVEATQPNFLEQSLNINTILKKKSPTALSELMKISSTLAELNYERNQNFSIPFNEANARQAVYAFNGDVYKGLDVYNLPLDKTETLQNSVLILSGLYGVLKPLDLMQPYRLEMGTSLTINKSKNLYEFWKQNVTSHINELLADDEVFLNLASNEYFKVIDKKALKTPVITANFKDFKNGKYKVISFYAKQARGAMARYVIDTNAKTVDDLKGFDYNGYGFSEAESTEQDLVFLR